MPCCVLSMNLIGLRIFFKYNAGDSFKMDIPFGNKELFGNFMKIVFLFFLFLLFWEFCYSVHGWPVGIWTWF